MTATPRPRAALFVCTGNVCRSPFAERYAAAVAEGAGSPWVFASAGVHALVDQPMDAEMAQQLIDRGGDDAGFVARQVDRTQLAAAGLVLTMEGAHRAYLIEEYPAFARTIFTLRQVAAVLPEMGDGADLLQHLQRRRATGSAGDIRDPYRRGPQAAAESAEQIAQIVDAMVPHLP